MKLLLIFLLALSFSSFHSKIITQSGYWTQHFQELDAKDYQVSESPLAYEFEVTFPITFLQTPTAALALNMFDLHAGNPGVRVEARDIKKTGFKIYLEVQDSAELNQAGVQWIATVDPRIGFSYITRSKDNESLLPTTADDLSPKEFEVRLSYPIELTKPKVDVFLAGFGFAGEQRDNNLKLDVKSIDEDGVSVVYSTWDTTVLNSVAFYVLFYEDDPTFFQNTAETPYGEDSRLFDFSTNHEVRYELVNLNGMGNDTEGTFLGIQHLEFNATSDLRLEMDCRRNADLIEVKYLTRHDASIKFIKNSVLVLPLLDSIVEVSKTYTQTGLIGKNFLEDGHPFALDDSTDRFVVYRAQYPQRFRKTPKVMVGAIGFNIEENNPGFQIDVISSSPTDFYIKMTVKKGTILKSFQAGWLATISPNLKLTQYYKDLTPAEIKAALDPETNTVKYVIPYKNPTKFENPGIGIAFNGFQFAGKNNVVLSATYQDLTVDGFNLVVEATNNDIQLKSFSVIVMHFEATDFRSAKSVQISSIAKGSAGEATATVFNDAEFFVGLNEFDMSHEGGFEFKQDFSVKGTEFTATLTSGKNSQINTITDLILVVPHNKMTVRLYSQNGRFYKTFKDSTSDFFFNNTYDRVETFEIAFNEKFDQIPEVALSFNGFHLDGDSIGLDLEIESVTPSKFTFTLTAFAGTTVSNVEITWYATVNDEVTIGYNVLDPSNDEFRTTFRQPGNRFRNFILDPPGVEFDNTGAQVFLSGFKFGRGSAPLVYSWVRDVNHAGANIVYGTIGQTLIEKLRFVVIQYEKNNKNRGVLLESQYAGDLWKWSGQRFDSINVNNLGNEGLDFFGISGFDFEVDHEYAFHEDLNVNEEGTMELNMNVWGRSKLGKLTTSVFHTVISE